MVSITCCFIQREVQYEFALFSFEVLKRFKCFRSTKFLKFLEDKYSSSTRFGGNHHNGLTKRDSLTKVGRTISTSSQLSNRSSFFFRSEINNRFQKICCCLFANETNDFFKDDRRRRKSSTIFKDLKNRRRSVQQRSLLLSKKNGNGSIIQKKTIYENSDELAKEHSSTTYHIKNVNYFHDENHLIEPIIELCQDTISFRKFDESSSKIKQSPFSDNKENEDFKLFFSKEQNVFPSISGLNENKNNVSDEEIMNLVSVKKFDSTENLLNHSKEMLTQKSKMTPRENKNSPETKTSLDNLFLDFLYNSPFTKIDETEKESTSSTNEIETKAEKNDLRETLSKHSEHVLIQESKISPIGNKNSSEIKTSLENLFQNLIEINPLNTNDLDDKEVTHSANQKQDESIENITNKLIDITNLGSERIYVKEENLSETMTSLENLFQIFSDVTIFSNRKRSLSLHLDDFFKELSDQMNDVSK